MSDASRERRALALLDEVLEQPGHARAQWIAQHVADDEVLAHELRQLLAAAERTVGVLDERPAVTDPGTLQEALGEALRDRYSLTREIGRGGMATVFLAHERKHDRDVVIKVLDPSVAHLFGAERFLREVRIAATLAHPHIVPLIDSGDADGFLYYVMPWMEGRTVRERLRAGRPAVTETVGILRDVAGALAFAHSCGIVHRDLKPENVLLTAGHAYLLDFGIAKLVDEAPGGLAITSPGFPLGTRRYMAPEQAAGAADVDARADVYAWGILGIELLCGVSLPPSAADAEAQRLLAREPAVPLALGALLRRCLAADPAQRPATMGEVVVRLDEMALTPPSAPAIPSAAPVPRPPRWRLLVPGMAAVALLLAGGAWWRARSAGTSGSSAMSEPVAVAVLANETGDSTMDVLGRFAGDWVTEGLQRTGLVRVVPWSEARLASERATATGTPLVTAMRDELRAGTVVTGSIYRRRDSLHFHGQIVDARSGRLVSSLPPVIVLADSNEAGIAQLRDRVMGAVAAIHDERVAALPGLTRSPPSFPAYQAFDLGFEQFLAQRYEEALASFQQAFARDTTFTLALLMGARAAYNHGSFATAESLVVRARAQRRDLGVYHESALRYIEAVLAGDGVTARAAIQRAAAIAPTSRAGYDHAQALLSAGYARSAWEQLAAMDPDRGEMRGWSSYWTQRAHAAYLLGRHDDEARAAREMARRYPDRRVATVLEARALASAGRVRALDSALAAWDSLPADVYWSQGAAMVVAGEELMRRGRATEGRRFAERGATWLTNRLVALPTDRSHRYWLGSALYDLGRYEEATPYFEGLAREFPERLQFRGLAAMTAMRRGDSVAAARWLGSATSRQRGEHLVYQARLAAVHGDVERAIGQLTAALEAGVDGYPWVPGSAFRDFEQVERTARGRALLVGR